MPAGYTLIELVIATGIIGLVYGMILNCYIQAGLNAEWSGYSLAAQSLAIDQIEQARQASWDPTGGNNSVNNLTNLNLLGKTYTNTGTTITLTGYTTNILDIPYATTNYVIATNYVTSQIIYLYGDTNLAIPICMLQVNTVWPFYHRSGVSYYTNTVVTYLAPDNESPTNLVASH